MDAKGDFFTGDDLGLWVGVTVTERGVGLKLDGDYWAPIKLDKTGQPYTRSRVRADNFGVKTAAHPNFWYKNDTFARQF